MRRKQNLRPQVLPQTLAAQAGGALQSTPSVNLRNFSAPMQMPSVMPSQYMRGAAGDSGNKSVGKVKVGKVVKQAGQYAGAFNFDPTDIYGRLQNKQSKVQKKMSRLEGREGARAQRKYNRLGKKLNRITGAIEQVEGSYPYQMKEVNNQGNDLMQTQFDMIRDQGVFNPEGLPALNQDYGQMRQQAEQRVMDSFNRQMQPEFARQEASFREQMALQGVPEGSEKFNLQYEQMRKAQDSARQSAMDQSFQMGQSEQSQAFGQASQANQQMFGQQLQQYQNPYQNLGAFQPYYQGQMGMLQGQQDYQNQLALQNNANKFASQQAALDRQQQWNLANMGPVGGGGGGGYSDPFGATNSIYDQYIMQQQGGGLPPAMGTGNAFVGGIAQGIGAGITNSIFG